MEEIFIEIKFIYILAFLIVSFFSSLLSILYVCAAFLIAMLCFQVFNQCPIFEG